MFSEGLKFPAVSFRDAAAEWSPTNFRLIPDFDFSSLLSAGTAQH